MMNGRSIDQFGDYEIFDFGDKDSPDGSIEDPNSNFNQHRLAVIRYCIEKNLSIAIANYNNYDTTTADFYMPKLDEAEWEKIINNVSIISFLQGLSIGGKIYNGYSILTNNKNKEVVKEDSIYILTGNNEYHRVNEVALLNDPNGNNPSNNFGGITRGYLNIDFEIKTVEGVDNKLYYMPQMNPRW